MTDRPILMSAPMVLASKREAEAPGTGKTQTRRILKPQPPRYQHYSRDIMDWGLSGIYHDEENSGPSKWWLDVQTDVDDNSHREIEVRFAVGDRLWVRETHRLPRNWVASGPVYYEADKHFFMNQAFPLPEKQRPAIHMPRWASRLTLTVADVRVERLHAITSADAIAEGFIVRHNSMTIDCDTPNPRDWYRELWDTINGVGAWDLNPWIVAVTFRPELKNIDDATPSPGVQP